MERKKCYGFLGLILFLSVYGLVHGYPFSTSFEADTPANSSTSGDFDPDSWAVFWADDEYGYGNYGVQVVSADTDFTGDAFGEPQIYDGKKSVKIDEGYLNAAIPEDDRYYLEVDMMIYTVGGSGVFFDIWFGTDAGWTSGPNIRISGTTVLVYDTAVPDWVDTGLVINSETWTNLVILTSTIGSVGTGDDRFTVTVDGAVADNSGNGYAFTSSSYISQLYLKGYTIGDGIGAFIDNIYIGAPSIECDVEYAGFESDTAAYNLRNGEDADPNVINDPNVTNIIVESEGEIFGIQVVSKYTSAADAVLPLASPPVHCGKKALKVDDGTIMADIQPLPVLEMSMWVYPKLGGGGRSLNIWMGDTVVSSSGGPNLYVDAGTGDIYYYKSGVGWSDTGADLEEKWSHLAVHVSTDGTYGNSDRRFIIFVDGVVYNNAEDGYSFADDSLAYTGLSQVRISNSDSYDATGSYIDQFHFGAPKTCMGWWGYHSSDLNKDCYVDIEDFAIMVGQWLNCSDPLISDCTHP